MPLADTPFLRACRGLPTGHVPVWFMRQAGRSLPEYRAERGTGSILDAIKQPPLAAKLTLQPVHRYGVDAAILFSDIVVPLAAVGFGVDVETGRGPVVARPFAGERDLERLAPLDPERHIPYVIETVGLVVEALGSEVPLIGLAGGPFTVASYLIEGGPSRTYARTKALMRGEPETFARLLDALADMAISFLRAQVSAGCSAVQMFDSWVGALSAEDYRRFAFPASSKVFAALADLEVPRIHFGVGTGELLGLMASAGADVVGVDWRVPLDEARRRIGPGPALQGNLDPTVCLAPWPVVEESARDVVRRGGLGHVFNLGHGVLPETDPATLKRLVALVHSLSPEDPASRDDPASSDDPAPEVASTSSGAP